MAQKDRLSKTAQIESIDYLKGVQMTIETIHNSPAEQMPQLLQNIGPSNYHDVLLGYILKGKEHLLNVNPLDYEEFYVKSHTLINHGVNTGLLSQEDANLIKSTVNEITETAKKNAQYLGKPLLKQQVDIDVSLQEGLKGTLSEIKPPHATINVQDIIGGTLELLKQNKITREDFLNIINKYNISKEDVINVTAKYLKEGKISERELIKILDATGIGLQDLSPEIKHEVLFGEKLTKTLQEISEKIKQIITTPETKTEEFQLKTSPSIEIKPTTPSSTDVDAKVQVSPLDTDLIKDVPHTIFYDPDALIKTYNSFSDKQEFFVKTVNSAKELIYNKPEHTPQVINVLNNIVDKMVQERHFDEKMGNFIKETTIKNLEEMGKKLLEGQQKMPLIKEQSEHLTQEEQEEIQELSRRIFEKSQRLLKEYVKYFDSIEVNYEKIEEEDFLLIAHLISDLAPYSHVAFLVNELIKIKGHYSDLHDEVVSIARHLLVSAFETLRIALINHISEANNYIQKYLKGGEE